MFVAAFLAALHRRWIERATLHALSQLDDRALDDIGLVRGQIADCAAGRR